MKRSYFFAGITILVLLSTLLTSCSTALIQPTLEEETQTRDSQESNNDSKSTQEKNTTENKKEPAVNIMQKSDPKEDGVIQVLMIGNSFCYYYTDELFGMAKAAGIKMEISNVYYSGCPVQFHWKWLQSDETSYQFVTHTEKGRTVRENYSLRRCLAYRNWDMISLQQHFSPSFAADLESCRQSCAPYTGLLVSYLKEQFPLSKMYWQQTWAYEIGYNQSNGRIADLATQLLHHENIRTTSLELCDKYSLTCIPSGDAWKLARTAGHKNLTARKGVNDDNGDYFHDGDIGGGQYLNACVWFEVLTGQSCVGNAFRPSYNLSEEDVLDLQRIAHQAVEEAKR